MLNKAQLRHGTASNRAFSRLMLGGNTSALGTLIHATRRQNKKALALYIAGKRAWMPCVKGRVIRAILRDTENWLD